MAVRLPGRAIPGPTSPSWESQLARRLRDGEQRALLELYDQTGSLVYGLALRVAGSPQAAEAVTQGVYLDVWADPGTLDVHGATIRGRLAVLTHGRAVRHRRLQGQSRTEESRSACRGRRASPPFSDAQELAEALATAARMRGALATLPSEQRSALDVTYFGGNTLGAAAALLGWSRARVAAQARAALRHLAGTPAPAVPAQVRRGARTSSEPEGLPADPTG